MGKNISYFEARNITPEYYKNYKIPFYLQKRLPSNKEARILDFGCGFGQILKELRRLGYKNIFGADVDKEAIRFCKSQGFSVIDISDLNEFVHNYKSYFDMIIMSHVLEHIPKDEIIPTLRKLKQVLKDEGIIFIMVPNAQGNTGAYWAYEDFTHTTLFTSGSIYFVLKKAGFEDIKFVDIDCTEGLSKLKKLIRILLMKYYKFKIDFWNKVTASYFHEPSPKIFSYEIKVMAKKPKSIYDEKD